MMRNITCDAERKIESREMLFSCMFFYKKFTLRIFLYDRKGIIFLEMPSGAKKGGGTRHVRWRAVFIFGYCTSSLAV